MLKFKNTLYSKNKNGTYQQWSVYTDNDLVIVEYGKEGGKLQTKTTTCLPKNVGKKNETTPEQQALLEAESKYTKQIERKGYRDTKDALESLPLSAMLAQDYLKVPHMATPPFYCQPKLDGVRGLIVRDKDTETVKVVSRKGEEYTKLPDDLLNQISDYIRLAGLEYLDGEFYIHGYKLQEINSALKNVDNPLREKLEFHIFDVPENDKPFNERLDNLKKLKSFEEFENFKKIKIIHTTPLINTLDEIEVFKESFEASGYEGIMIRNESGLYESGKRSNDLLKYKSFQDSEAKIIAFTKDKNDEYVFLCSWCNPDELVVEFSLKIKGTHEERSCKSNENLLHSWVNFKYQDLTKEGRPTFPVGNYIRDCDEEGKPLT